MTYDTTFVGTDDGLTADNILKPAKGEVFLLHRDDNNFVASQSDITDNLLADIEGTPVANKYGIDNVGPTFGTMPNWGASVASGSTTAKTVTVTDDNAWTQLSGLTITVSNGGSITGLAPTDYGVIGFNLVAPVNNTGAPLTITITYVATDHVGNTTTTVQYVDVDMAI